MTYPVSVVTDLEGRARAAWSITDNGEPYPGVVLALYSAAVALVTGATSAWLSYYFGSRKELFAWQREQALRWDGSRREAYSAYAAAVKREVRIHVKMAASKHPELWPGHEVLDISTGWPLLVTAEDERAALLESILLLADGPTVAAAREWQQKVWELRRLHNDTSITAESVRQALAGTSDARDRFYACARADLGILAPLPSPAPLPHQREVTSSAEVEPGLSDHAPSA
ncbi:hypothetical protein [Nocardia sp. NPDC059236]|uniref:hypothetical protein n=1 Tax=Nocardia sp. NPDC059236 TaxID=3346783 RepID=UPI0036AC42FD